MHNNETNSFFIFGKWKTKYCKQNSGKQVGRQREKIIGIQKTKAPSMAQ